MAKLPSLWTYDDSKALRELVRKRGMCDVLLCLRDIARDRGDRPDAKPIADWPAVAGTLTRVYDHIAEGRDLPS